MTKILNFKFIIGIALIAIVAVFGVTQVYANPQLFTQSAKTQTATTTLAYLTPGTATTTLVYDTREQSGTNQAGGNNTYIAETVTLKQYLKASSTATVLVTNFEFSDDKIDWYQNNLETYAAGAIAIATPNSYTWTFASSTIGGVLNGNGTDVGAKVISVKVPTRYVRAVFTMTGANGAIWAELLPKKQIANTF